MQMFRDGKPAQPCSNCVQGELKDAEATASKASSAEQDANNLKADVDRLRTQLDEKTKQLQDADSNSSSLKVRRLNYHSLMISTGTFYQNVLL